MKFLIKGKFRMGRVIQNFNKEIEADNKKNALEKLYAKFGSDHKVKRRFIKVEEIKNA